ncbi:hypothetical protein [Photobacterium damselae]|uniref:hypothetical protein n=1 Tax=Photobacterium damselae TaxID=38293 RepID=UPI001302710D|nr:hypothetical protein [Photobacterium damselae]
MKFRFLILSISGILSAQANALAIDNMLYFIHKANSTKIELINNESRKAFIKIGMSKIEVKDNSLHETELSSRNINDWNITLTPSKTIMEPKQAKSISVHYNCFKNCDRAKDEIYKLSILPVPYGEDGKLTDVKLGFGFAPYVIVPAIDQNPSYSIKYTKDKKGIIFSNTGNTFLNAVIDICKKEINKQCNISHRMLPGRTKTFKLNDEVQKLNSIKFYVVNYDESYKNITVIHK